MRLLLRLLFTLLLLALLAVGGYLFWARGPGAGGAGAAADPGASPELADATLDRFEDFQAGPPGREMHLGDAELSSLVRYALPGMVPPGVSEPTVSVREGQVHLAARVAVATLPELPALKDVVGFLPDTVPVEVRATLHTHGGERAALHVDRVEAARIPLPSRYIPDILSALGRVPVQDLPPEALAVPLPRGLSGAFVRGDSLVLVSGP